MKKTTLLLVLLSLFTIGLFAQQDEEAKSPLNESTFQGLKMRSVGPAFTSGRIADIAIHPDDNNLWYVAVGSGGVWKTHNAGVTWQPIFDNQPSYSTGCITIDPNNPHTIWLGTGENVGGRHVGYGDGVYRSTDGGKTWKNMGLKASEHISKIIVHPSDPNIIWVAAQGPLWSKGDQRGLYKSTDGGENWNKVLGDDEWTGVTDIVMDPRNPDLLYAATWQRHRTVAAYMGGGPGSGIHKSTDGGATWTELTNGIPSSYKGKIGLAISPQKPDVVYAAIELNRTEGGVWRSTNRGASWEKRSDAVSGATGPHYYQELYASPHAFDRLYLMDVRIQVSDDGGKNFRRLQESGKHSDSHAMAFRMDDPDYLLVGTDGGLYESYDLAENWRFIDNMPITQYYKVAVDDAEPFYFIYGGTQDNGSHGGPSRTDTRHGILNRDWFKTLGADGHQSATEPGNPNITYAETQQGGLHRIDRITGEQVFIQPQPDKGEDYERFNWDSPILVSPHSPTRLYFASQRVWRSDDRGNNWTPVSEDLTRDQERIELPIMGRKWSWDAPWDVNAMSNYNTITSLAESPLQEGLLYAGTDDGIIQVSEDGGENWRKIEVGTLPGVPEKAFVNDIKADLHDANTVYVALDNHKYGDFAPYLYKSTDRGQSWESIGDDLPERHLVWRLVQDHVEPNLMFAATEYGIFFTLDGGGEWIQLKGGVPTIAFRDLAIQRRENDLVGASFGRSFYVLDNYSVLREVTEEKLAEEGSLYNIRRAWWYMPRSIVSSQGAFPYEGENPPYGAVFTYHLAESLMTKGQMRKKEERKLKKEQEDVPFPGWEALEAEKRQPKPQIFLTVKDEAGKVVREVNGPTSKGFHRVAWDLRHASNSPIRLGQERTSWRDGGLMAVPGTYTVTLSKVVDGETTVLDGPREFEVKRLREGALEPKPLDNIVAFREDLEDLQEKVSAANIVMDKSMDKVEAMATALGRTHSEAHDLRRQLHDLHMDLLELQEEMSGGEVKDEIGERSNPTVRSRMFAAYRGMFSTYGPTETHQKSLDIAEELFAALKPKLDRLSKERIPALEEELQSAGAPWIEGAVLPKNKE